MGKKMGINTKAVEAREHKANLKKAKEEAAERKRDEEFWKDDDKHVNRKINRKKEKDDKVQAERDRKLANKAAYERDMESAEKDAKKGNKSKIDVIAPKVTRHEIKSKLDEETTKLSKQLKNVNIEPIQLVPNINRLDDGENASTVDQALELLESR